MPSPASPLNPNHRETFNNNYGVIPQEEAKRGADVSLQLLQYILAATVTSSVTGYRRAGSNTKTLCQ